MSEQIAVGVDIVGTLVRVGAFDGEGQFLGQKEAGMVSIGPDNGLSLIEQLIRETLDTVNAQSLLGIGIGCTGPLDTVRRLVNNPYTLAGWGNVPIVERLNGAFHVPVRLENDADAAVAGRVFTWRRTRIHQMRAVVP